jgi:hypothetical protein
MEDIKPLLEDILIQCQDSLEDYNLDPHLLDNPVFKASYELIKKIKSGTERDLGLISGHLSLCPHQR